MAIDLIKLNIRVGLSFNIYIFNSNFLFQKLCSVTKKNNHPSCHNSITIHDGKKPPPYFPRLFLSSRNFIPLSSSFHSYFVTLTFFKLCQTRTRTNCQPIR
ncbi:hypothetical protein Hanom_Chr04g00359011 [Helianthus anomalus]